MPRLEDQTNMYLVNPVNTGMQDWSQTNISIIIPAYNCHNTIVQTLASIAMQENVHEIETIIADDCSDYPYDDIAKAFSKFMKIKVVRLLKGGGPGTARQVGYDHSIGKYVSFMDGDDSLIGCDAINTLKRVMIERDQDCVYGQFLEQNENGDLHVHEVHMVWMFGKLYKRSFLEHYNIRMNMSHSNEDTGYNCVVKGCSSKVWYIPKPVYTWRFKPNSITRFNNGMYGNESGMCGYLTNMVWQIKELEKRFVNKNYILSETIAIMCTLYHFYVENLQRYPLGKEMNMEWCRYYYEQCYKPYEDRIDEGTLNQVFAQVSAGQNLAAKGIIPRVTFFEFMEEVKAKPYTFDPMHAVGGSVIEIPQTTPENYPVKITEYFDNLMEFPKVNTNTNLARMDGMQRILEKDKEQRAEFLENEIKPNLKEPIEEEKKSSFLPSFKETQDDCIGKVTKDDTESLCSDKEINSGSTATLVEVPIVKEEIDYSNLSEAEKRAIRFMRGQQTLDDIVIPCGTGTPYKIPIEVGDVIPNPYEVTCLDSDSATSAVSKIDPSIQIYAGDPPCDCGCCDSISCTCSSDCDCTTTVYNGDVPSTATDVASTTSDDTAKKSRLPKFDFRNT